MARFATGECKAIVWVGWDLENERSDYDTDAQARKTCRLLRSRGLDAHYITKAENADRLNGKWK